MQTSLIGFLFALLKVSNSKSPLYINLTSIDEYIPVQSSTIRLGIASVDTVATLTIFGEQDTMLHWQNMEAFQELLGVIRSMNGKLFTENNLKKFVVQITIPLKMSQIQTPFKNKPGTIDTKSILVVDDDMLVLKSIEDVLVNAGYNVFSYQDPVQAIKLFKQNYTKIGLVILDMRMPKITGKKFFFKCKKIDPLVKTLIISGYCSDSDVQEMIDLGVIGYIEKPYTEEDLSSQVASYMNHV